MICRSNAQGEVITITMADEPVITLIATGSLWNSAGQLLDVNFILDQSTLG